MKRELNDRYLRSLKPDPERRIEVSDTKCVGLRFRLSPLGKASWVYEKRIRGGAKRKFSLGTWPKPTGLSDARKLAFEIQAEAARGFDRVDAAKEEKERAKLEAAKSVTCRAVLEAYNELHLSTLRAGAERERQIKQSLGDLLDTPIHKITRKDIQAAVDAKARSGARKYANRIRAALLAFLNWAFMRGYLDEPVASGIAKATKEEARERVLSLDEVRGIYVASKKMGDVWGPFFRMLVLTGQRRGEIASLRWSEVNFADRLITKPGSRTKNAKPHKTHLSDAALNELHALSEEKSSKEFVFSFDGEKPVANPSHAKSRLDKLLGEDFESWRIHDLRTAMATALAGAGESESVVDRILNHAASGSAPSAVARVYNQAELLNERAVALDKWAELVTQEGQSLAQLQGAESG